MRGLNMSGVKISKRLALFCLLSFLIIVTEARRHPARQRRSHPSRSSDKLRRLLLPLSHKASSSSSKSSSSSLVSSSSPSSSSSSPLSQSSSSSSSSPSSDRTPSARASPRKPSPDALSKLSKVFGISRIPAKIFHRSPPQYMKDLYASITDTGGLSTKSGPYNSNVIRSFPDKDSLHRMHFHYNLSHLEEDERILQGEFHIFKMRPKPSGKRESKPPHVIVVRVYQVLDIRDMTAPKNIRLLDAKTVSAYGHGWFVFNVTKAVFTWTSRQANNFGLLVTAQSMSGQNFSGSYIRFAQRNEHHDSKQPVLVVFGAEGKRKHHNYISPNDHGYREIKEDIMRRERQKATRSNLRQGIMMLNERQRQRKAPSRTKRSAKNRGGNRRKRTYDMYRYRHNRRSCSRYEMFVDFEEIGWSGWIISPNSYNAYHCAGDCPFPLGQGQKPTNHATVQSIVHALGVGKNVGTPCCVPNKLYSISLLYFDDNENVVLKQYDDMVVASCGCH